MDHRHLLNQFDDFLFLMDDQLDAVRAEAQRQQLDLDLSLDDLVRPEALFDAVAEEETTPERRTDGVIDLGRHLGELVCHRFGGRWMLYLDDPKNVDFNQPVIIGHSPVAGLHFAPLRTMRAYALRRRRGLLRTAVMADVQPPILDLGDLIEN